jgi:hypothetical protein
LILWWWAVPTWETISEISTLKERVASQIEFVKTMAQIILGALVFGTLYFTWRRVAAAERTAEAAEQTVKVAQEGQITERFTKAVEQLGNSESMAIRLGGIYALERIAKDSKNDHWPVMEVLTAYVRGNSPKEVPPDGEEPAYKPVATDIQAILTVLGRRNVQHEKPCQVLDLADTDLRGADFRRAKIAGIEFSLARLNDVTFSEAELTEARFCGATLDGANFTRSILRGADFGVMDIDNNGQPLSIETSVRYANFRDADIRGADLRRALDLTLGQVNASGKRDDATKLPRYLRESQNP